VSLQRAYRHRLTILVIAHTGAFAQHFGGTYSGANSTHDVLLKNVARGPGHVAGADLANEAGNVYARGAGLHTGRVVAEIAAIAFDERLVRL
jgi:hypothetical protein